MALDYGANVNYQDVEQCAWSALHFSCYFSGRDKSAERICKMLVQRGSSVNLKAVDGTTPLMTAASIGSPEVVDLLLTKGPDVDALDAMGRTPLMGAAERGDIDVVNSLLNAGANPLLLDHKGMNAMQISSAAGLYGVSAQIEAAMLIAEVGSASVQSYSKSTLR
jgi:ankyrin repeat protein